MRLAAALGHVKNPRKYRASDFWADPACSIGLEWELERASALYAILADQIQKGENPYFQLKQDGSLRDNGLEIVTSGDGLFGEDLLDAIHLLDNTIKAMTKDRRPTCNYRTAFHVHLDVRDLETEEVHNLLLLYCLLERPIFNFVGKDRDQSNFCVPWFRSDSYFQVIKGLSLHSLREPSSTTINSIAKLQRYSALNCQSLSKFGTLEFRHMENDLSEITGKQVALINLTMRLKNLARDFFRKGLYGEALFGRLKAMSGDELLHELRFPLPQTGWDYPESLMLAAGMVQFKVPAAFSGYFNDAIFSKFAGNHPNWK